LGWNNNLDDLVAASSPSLKMFELAKEKFKDIPFGDFQSARWSPLAIKYEDVFLKEDGKTMNGTIEKVIDGIVGVLEWIEAKKDNPAEFHHAGIESRVRQCIDDWKKTAADQMDKD
jgi:hypothetical protein